MEAEEILYDWERYSAIVVSWERCWEMFFSYSVMIDAVVAEADTVGSSEMMYSWHLEGRLSGLIL
mgnify:CR=1 FL=1